MQNLIDIPNIEPSPYCDKCNRKIFGEITKFDCNCLFCEQCLWEHLNIHLLYELQVGDVDIPCCNPRCKMGNFEMRFIKGERAIQLREKFLDRNKVAEIRELLKMRLIFSDTRTQMRCMIDGEWCRPEETVTFFCGCKICEKCCREYLLAIKDRMNTFEVPCFNAKCKAPENQKGFKHGKYLFEKLFKKDECEKFIFSINRQTRFVCSNFGCSSTFDLAGCGNQDFFHCVCGAETCLKCMKKRHKGRECDKVDPETKEFLKNEESVIRICPNPKCLEAFTKDNHSDHVRCLICKVDFCFACSVIRPPTMEHGNHYHRKDCRHYSPWIDKDGKEVFDDKFNKSCSECAKLGKLCERPKQNIREFYVENKALEYLEIFEEQKEEEELDG